MGAAMIIPLGSTQGSQSACLSRSPLLQAGQLAVMGPADDPEMVTRFEPLKNPTVGDSDLPMIHQD